MSRANGSAPEAAPLLRVSDLTIAFPAGDVPLLAADRVSFDVEAGTTVGLVGESGCGKSVTLRSLLGLVPYPGEVLSGEVSWEGEDLLGASKHRITALRGSEISMIFQDPTACLNPVFTIGDQITETLRKRAGVPRREAEAAAGGRADHGARRHDPGADPRIVDGVPAGERDGDRPRLARSRGYLGDL
jgi:ABC-type glutathione transport system ATPase component